MLSVGFSKGLIKVGEAKDWFIKQDTIERLKTGGIPNEYSQEHSKGITHGCLCNFSATFFARNLQKRDKSLVAMKLFPAVWLFCIYRMQELDGTRRKTSHLHHCCLLLRVTTCNTLQAVGT